MQTNVNSRSYIYFSDMLISQIWINLYQQMQFKYNNSLDLQCTKISTCINLLGGRAPVVIMMQFLEEFGKSIK